MTKKYIYTENKELWAAENRAKASGWEKTSDCYWCQIFRKGEDEVITSREDEGTPTNIEEAFTAEQEQETPAETPKAKFEIREIDALQDEDCGWIWNTSYHIAEFETNAKDEKRAFLYQLHKLGITCKHGMCYVYFDGDVYELRDRKTHEPLFAAIPMEE